MNKIIKILSLCLVLVIFTVGCASEAQKSDTSNIVIATVNGVEIYQDIFDKNVALYSLDYVNEFGEDILEREMGSGKTLLDIIRESVLDKLIMEELLLQLAAEQNIVIDEKVIKDAYEEYQEFAKDNEEFEKFSNEYGIDEDFIKSELRKDKTIKTYQEFFIQELAMDHEKARKFYDENPDLFLIEEVRASHILVSDAELADDLYNRIVEGESFEDLARAYSEDPGSAAQGGDLGYFTRGVMIPEFEEVAFALEVGNISFPVNSVFGYHIIRTDDKKSEMEDFEEIKDALVLELESYEFNKHIEEKIEQSEIEKFM